MKMIEKWGGVLMERRIGKSHFFGLTATILSLAFLLVLILFVGTVKAVQSSDFIIEADHHVAQLMTVFRSPKINIVFLLDHRARKCPDCNTPNNCCWPDFQLIA